MTGMRSWLPFSGANSAWARVANSWSRAAGVVEVGASVGLRTTSRLVKRLRSERSCAFSCDQSSSSAAGSEACGVGAGAGRTAAHPLRKTVAAASTVKHLPTHHLRALSLSMGQENRAAVYEVVVELVKRAVVNS